MTPNEMTPPAPDLDDSGMVKTKSFPNYRPARFQRIKASNTRVVGRLPAAAKGQVVVEKSVLDALVSEVKSYRAKS